MNKQIILAMLLAGLSHAALADWGKVEAPSLGAAEAIGAYGSGCIAGAVGLPADGTGYQAIHLDRNRHYGHPKTIAFVEDLARRAKEKDLGTLLIGDMAQPRGGPMSYGHVSHQTGLDVDIWFRLDVPPLPREAREDLDLPSMVAEDGRGVDAERWTEAQAELVRLAATDPRVVRIFVNPTIKHALCEARWPDRSWLSTVRPWGGHDRHFHVRLACPADSAHCLPQPPPPPGDGCGEELATWLTTPPRGGTSPTPAPAPELCEPVLRAD